MQSRLVRYHNQLNRVPLKRFSEVEQNFFVALIYKVKNQGLKQIRISKSELIELTGFKQGTQSNFEETVAKFVEKLLNFKISYSPDAVLVKSFVPFNEIDYDTVEKHIKINVSESFKDYVNLVETNFTQFELSEFIEISGKYAKILYRHLKQFKDTGYFVCEWSDFVDIMDIPKSYKTSDIERQILKPAIAELSAERSLFNQNVATFDKLSYNKIRGKTRGRAIARIEFFWKVPKVKEEEINIFSSIDELRSWLFCNVDSGTFSTNIANIKGKMVTIARFGRRGSSKYTGTKILVNQNDYTSKEEADWALTVLHEAIKKDQLDNYAISPSEEFSHSKLLYDKIKLKMTDRENLKRCTDEVREVYPKAKKLIEKYLYISREKFEGQLDEKMFDKTFKVEDVFISYENRNVSLIVSLLEDGEKNRLIINDLSTLSQYELIKSAVITPTKEVEEKFSRAKPKQN